MSCRFCQGVDRVRVESSHPITSHGHETVSILTISGAAYLRLIRDALLASQVAWRSKVLRLSWRDLPTAALPAAATTRRDAAQLADIQNHHIRLVGRKPFSDSHSKDRHHSPQAPVSERLVVNCPNAKTDLLTTLLRPCLPSLRTARRHAARAWKPAWPKWWPI